VAAPGAETLGERRLVAPRWGLLVGLGATAVLVLVALIGAALMWSSEAHAPATTAPPPPPPVATVAEPEPAPVDTRPDVTPWETDGVPPLLARLYDKVSDERELSERELVSLRRYANQHSTDALSCLVLGHANELRGARTDAVSDYERALVRDEHAARGDPLTLPRLLDLVAYDHPTSNGAARLVWNYWGPRARSAVDERIASEDDPRLRARLERLRTSLEPGGTDPTR